MGQIPGRTFKWGGGVVYLQDTLHATGDVVVLLAQNTGVEHTGGGIQRVHSGVDTQLSDGAGQHGGGVQVSEGGSRGGVSQIIGGHVDGLHKHDISARNLGPQTALNTVAPNSGFRWELNRFMFCSETMTPLSGVL